MYSMKEKPILTKNSKVTDKIEVKNNELIINDIDVITYKNDNWYINDIWQGIGCSYSINIDKKDIIDNIVFNNIFEEVE